MLYLIAYEPFDDPSPAHLPVYDAISMISGAEDRAHSLFPRHHVWVFDSSDSATNIFAAIEPRMRDPRDLLLVAEITQNTALSNGLAPVFPALRQANVGVSEGLMRAAGGDVPAVAVDAAAPRVPVPVT